MFIKICGVTNLEVAAAAIDGGAEALGFIFHPASPRYIAPASLARWIESVPRRIWRVGVFLDRPRAEVEQVCAALGLDVAQLHGSESVEEFPGNVRVWKAMRIGHGDRSLTVTAGKGVEAILLDGPASGESFDWKLARGLKHRVILAGGLNEDNVASAIEQAEPWGIDACSSLESSPGKKDYARMARFLQACQLAALKQQ